MNRTALIIQIDKLDKEMKDLLAKLESFSEEKLNHKVDEETWSPIQILDHLILSEKLSLAYCKKKLSFDPKLKKANFRTWINGRIVTYALMSPFKFKAPSMVAADQFAKENTLENVEKQWNKLRNELREFIKNLPEKYIDKEVYKHPFGLRISLKGMLSFFKTHFRRHKKQLLSRI